jgi:hypothetical protein
MESSSFHALSTSTYEFNDPSVSSSNHELNPDLIDMVQDRPFFVVIKEDPYIHLKEFEDLCSHFVDVKSAPHAKHTTSRTKLA